ncbi:hypothetical protein KFJ24_14975 [Marinobacter sediminum]|uniref:anti-sigma factor family protein n=1 Tax=Marinobacter sediminum TaxID=256323 RepID=UPI00202FBD3B|nr:hypothetical protein [Marinobacter sediminum]MCM0613787.1 hypothetical protein [Marinobacter sediminum]
MNITDQTLSAFLDSELPEHEMQAVRERLMADPGLSDRLAELAAVDEQLMTHYSAIDDRPLPDALTAMLEKENQSSTQVVRFPWWRRMQQGLQAHTGMAVAAALVLGFGVAQLMTFAPPAGDAGWHAVAKGLETTPSGKSHTLDTGEQLIPRLTFTNQEGQYCRQFRLQGPDNTSENIACRTDESDDGWTRVAAVETGRPDQPEGYQTASGGSVLDSALDRMIAGEVLEPDSEKQLITHGWTSSQ